MQILENVIRFKWGALPDEQREGIKNFLSNLIISYTTDEAVFRRETTFINKLNIILVQILKHDWPNKWRTFIPDLVSASKTSETLCENSMKIFKLLSEEVFDFARLDLTQVGNCSTSFDLLPGVKASSARSLARAHAHTHIHTHIHTHRHIRTHTRAHTHTHTHTHMHDVHLHAHTNRHTPCVTYICMHVHAHVA